MIKDKTKQEAKYMNSTFYFSQFTYHTAHLSNSLNFHFSIQNPQRILTFNHQG